MLLLVALATLITLPLRAQDEAVDDKTFLETWLEKNLSGAGRQVIVTGFQGALSSQATMQRMTIADDKGVWLTLEGAVLDWTRSALLTGRLEIDALRAQRIEIARRPVSAGSGPSATASDFALPELPVAVNIGEITAERVELGAPVLGVPAVLRLSGGGRLEAGEGAAKALLERIDGAEGRFAITAEYDNASRVLGLDFALAEGPQGVAATLTGLPGGPPLELTLAGRGPIDDFSADLALATDGVPRLSGRLTLAKGDMEALGEVAEGSMSMAFRAALTGDPGALLRADYSAFFGPDSRLSLEGQRAPDGRMRIDAFTVATDALSLTGSALIGANGWPERARISGAITAGETGTVLLPIGGAQIRLAGAEIGFDYDVALGDAWRGRLALSGLERAGLGVAQTTIDGTGTLDPGSAGAIPGLAGRVNLSVTGLSGAAGSAVEALGASLSGGFDFDRAEAAPLTLANIALAGADYRLGGDLALDLDTTRVDLIGIGALTLAADDLSRFSALASQPLSGAATLSITGTAALPGGPFDVLIEGTGRDLGAGRPELDRLFAGASRLTLAVARDESGTRIDRFTITAPGASATASGVLGPANSHLAATLDLPDATRIAEGLAGPVHLSLTARDTGALWSYALDARAPGGVVASAGGTADIGADGLGKITASAEATVADLSAWSGLAGRRLAGRATLAARGGFDAVTSAFEVSGTGQGARLAFDLGAADPLTAGESRASFALRRDGEGRVFVDEFDLSTANLTLNATGESLAGVPQIKADARLRDLGLIVPGLPGAFALSGEARLEGEAWRVTGRGTGPAGTTLAASGTLAADLSRANLALAGTAPLGFANGFVAPNQLSGMAAFDLRLDGPPTLTSLSGRVTTSDGRISVPGYAIALDPVTGSLSLAGGQAALDLSARVSTGGRLAVTGPVRLSAPYTGDLAVTLAGVRLTDPALYDLTANGRLSLSGPLAGGALIGGVLSLSEVELQIPETGLGATAALEGLSHVGEPPAVHATRVRAGMTGQGAGGGGAAYGLDLAVSAPRAVFVRGRGLDAELGGQLLLGGTTADVVASGGFELIRGRLDLLGNRLTLKEGRVSMRGSLDPAVYLVAETRAEEVPVTITVDGLATDPKVTFASAPALPEDEILARLVFGRGLDQISPFQALKLASAVATLSGKSGAGTIGRLREGFGLADLDVTTTDTGLAARAGAYLSDNIYTDVTVGADGRAEINLNLTITPSLTAKGSVSTDGNSGIGIYFERDY